MWSKFLGIFFPSICLGCRANLEDRASALCLPCRAKIVVNDAFNCSKCSKRLPTRNQSIKKCGCEDSFIAGLAVNYESTPVRELIKSLKYSGVTCATHDLSGILSDFIKKSDFNLKNFFIVPIPLSRQRMRERGFNQSELIAAEFVSAQKMPEAALLNKVLIRVKATGQQAKMADYGERYKNVSGCFAVKDKQAIKGRQIIVIDDVFTSGATSSEAVRVLKSAGARKVIVLCAAKA